MLPLERSPKLCGFGLVPRLQLRTQGHEVLLVSVLEQPQLAGVPLLGLPQQGVSFSSEFLGDFSTLLQKPEGTANHTVIKAPSPSYPSKKPTLTGKTGMWLSLSSFFLSHKRPERTPHQEQVKAPEPGVPSIGHGTQNSGPTARSHRDTSDGHRAQQA